VRFELTTLVVIGTDCKSNYHTITTSPKSEWKNIGWRCTSYKPSWFYFSFCLWIFIIDSLLVLCILIACLECKLNPINMFKPFVPYLHDFQFHRYLNFDKVSMFRIVLFKLFHIVIVEGMKESLVEDSLQKVKMISFPFLNGYTGVLMGYCSCCSIFSVLCSLL
jgi:hypothetical protein